MKLAKLAPLVALVFVIAALSGRAYAYLTGTGQGTGSAAVAVIDAVGSPPISEPVNAVIEPLFPNGTGDLVVSVANPNPFPIGVRSITVVPGTIEPDDEACTTLPTIDDHVFDLVEVVAAGASRLLTVADGVMLAPDADDACQGVNFTVEVDVEIVTVTA